MATYEAPTIRRLGSLSELTAATELGGGLPFAQVSLSGAQPTTAPPSTTPAGSGGVAGDVGQGTPTPGPGATATPGGGGGVGGDGGGGAPGGDGGSGGGGGGTGGDSGGGGGGGTAGSGDPVALGVGGSGDGSLPFTGFMASGVAAVGAALVAAGAALRRASRQD